MHNSDTRFMVGLDVGSTTVKAVVSERDTDRVVWQDYQRHETKQPEKSLEFLRRIEADVGISERNCRVFVTGSGVNPTLTALAIASRAAEHMAGAAQRGDL